MFLRFFDQRKQIQALRQDVDELRREVNGLDVEWSDMHDRLRRMLAKISKREERARADGTEVREDASGGAVSNPGEMGLTASQLTHQTRILARRNRLSLAPKGE